MSGDPCSLARARCWSALQPGRIQPLQGLMNDLPFNKRPAGACRCRRSAVGWVFLACFLALAPIAAAQEIDLDTTLPEMMAQYPGKSGSYVLEKGEESLLTRAWLTDRAQRSIDVQYFIWSTDNIGTLAAEALLRAAGRGVRVRVLVDDLLIDAAERTILALAEHPNVSVRIYNPQHSVGVNRVERLFNIATKFRAVNQRMHDKTFLVDDSVAILGGRNMADEYYDYDQAYNFRDRDILLLGPVVHDMRSSFERFWASELAVPAQQQLADSLAKLHKREVQSVYDELHAYANDEENFAPEVRQALHDLSGGIAPLINALVWDEVRFVSDMPGKNDGSQGLAGGGRTTTALIAALEKAHKSVLIQSPYLVMPEGGIELFRRLIRRGVDVRISTNSLASTDNLEAFSGYHKQRESLLASGIEIFEFRPTPEIQQSLVERYKALEKNAPVFAIHAKTMVIDSNTLFIGTFNLDPRSANLNTEVGVFIDNRRLAEQVEKSIRRDMQPGNSWGARTDDPDAHAPLRKRVKLSFLKLLPLDPLL